MKKITDSEKLQLIGLMTLAQKHDRALTDIGAAVVELLGGKPEGRIADRVSDAMFGSSLAPDTLVDDLLGKLAYDEGRQSDAEIVNAL